MDPAARRRACVAFRAKLRRDTGANLTAAACEELLGGSFAWRGQQISLHSDPGRFYTCLAENIAGSTVQRFDLGFPVYEKVAWWCFREAAVVHQHPVGMNRLADCLLSGRGVTEDQAQAVVWFQKASDLGDTAAKTNLGGFLMNGNPRAGLVKDAARGFGLLCEAVELGCGQALLKVASCYLDGLGVEKDAVHGVSLLRQAVEQEDAMQAHAQMQLSDCYANGDGVEADTVQAALWCRRAAKGGHAGAIRNLPLILKCDFCGSTPARQLCGRCEKVRYCGRQCQLAHWNRAVNTHKGHCRRLV